MDSEKLNIFRSRKGFISALDQSGGSTPKALQAYGINEDQYSGEAEMYDLIHEMRLRIITSDCFTSDRILGTILYEGTVNRKIGDEKVPAYLWNKKKILAIQKIDVGLDEIGNGIQLMKPIPNIEESLTQSVANGVFGTKMRSVIWEATSGGINEIVAQQFEIAKIIMGFGLVPIVEPEVSIGISDKVQSEEILLAEVMENLDSLDENQNVALKLTIPSHDNFYSGLVEHPRVVRVTALSGGYTHEEACGKLARNPGMIASFSRALTERLKVDQTASEFSDALNGSIESIFQASIT
ncbi:MAG: fructose bisphosphate aldolase [Paracoccaceae bacterium]|nr:fructose bisphosphate aldolase [Paracoccaceae bacterium]MDE2674292.1 fructose bisphosphate aldolase [Paracoccaceae bacterium]MYG10983.1 fructose bisphosphate aldolase [Paracoccaceae bacterium]